MTHITPVRAAARAHLHHALPAAPAAPPRASQLPREGNLKTPQDVFDSMRAGFKAAKAKGVHAKYQFDISGPRGGHWYIVVDDGKATVAKGSIDGANTTFIASDEDWVRLSNGDLSGTLAFMAGRLRIKGDKGLAKQLDVMFP
jgi:putative sterol carrier protein